MYYTVLEREREREEAAKELSFHIALYGLSQQK